MNFIEEIKKAITDSIRRDIESMSMSKSEADNAPDSEQKPQLIQDQSDLVAGKALLTDPFYDQQGNNHFLTKNKISRISPRTLREISMRDWLVNTILQIRCDTVLRFSRPQEKKYDMGFKVFKTDTSSPMTKEDIENIKIIEDYIYHCGRTDGTPRGQEMLFSEFLKLVTWDALTHGHVAVEKILTRKKSLHRFRPLPSETIFRINPKINRQTIDSQAKAAFDLYSKKRSDNDPVGDGEHTQPDIEYFKYIQMSADNRAMMPFGDEEMVFRLFNPKNFPDSNGYAISMVEQAIIMITNHLNVESYNANYFTHGYAARGILHLKGTVTQNTLGAFRRQFYNTISGANNAWRTPIVAGLDDVQWIPMSGSAKEMEYINFNSHIMRSICAQFQIDPIEVGLDYLTTANGRAASQAKESGQFKITYSRERGLIPILMFVEDLINEDILPSLDKELSDKYKFKFVGYTDDTAQTDISLRQAQMTVFASMNDLLKNEDKQPIDHAVANVPLNQSFWALIEKNMTRGEIRETFFGDKGAASRPELQYIPQDPAFLSWNQLMMTITQQKKAEKQQQEQQEQQAQMQQTQMKMEQEKHEREGEAHSAEMDAQRQQNASDVTNSQSSADALRDIAKKYGATAATNIEGRNLRNPINVAGDLDKK